MSDKATAEDDAILLEDLDESSSDNTAKKNANISLVGDEEEMLLLSSPPSSPSLNVNENKNKTSTNDVKPDKIAEQGLSGVNVNSNSNGTKSSSLFTAPTAVNLNSNSRGGGNNNIVIDDSSESENSVSGNSVEVIGSEDDEELEEEFDEDEEDIIGESESEDEESLSAYLDGKVEIFMAQGSFFVWNADDVQMLRKECRIVGKLVGCLPRAPRQNVQLGLPLQLMPEEAKLLEDIEAACVVEEIESTTPDVTELRKNLFKSMREENYKLQQKMYKESRKEEVLQHKHIILEGKKAKKRKIKELEASGSETAVDKDSERMDSVKKCVSIETKINESESVSDEKSDTPSSMPTELEDSGGKNSEKSKMDEDDDDDDDNADDSLTGEKSSNDVKGEEEEMDKEEEENSEEDEEDDEEEDFNVDKLVTEETHIKHSLIQLFTENPWKESVKRPKHWIFPLSQKESLRYEVFRDLWKKGYFLTSGAKFGGDFLVYTGDPARFHSHFIAVCIDKTVDLSSLDIVSLGRLGSNVRKTVLLCAFNARRQIVYTSLQWTGIS